MGAATKKQEKNDEVAAKKISGIEADEKKLDEQEKQLALVNAKPGSPEDLKKKKLIEAIKKKRASLAKQKTSLNEFLKSDDPEERMRLWQEYKDEKDDFSKTEAFADHVGDVCIPCQFGLGKYTSKSKTVFAKVVEVSFEGDHKKLSPPADDDGYKDTPYPPFEAPHWRRLAGQPDRDYPVSYTKNEEVTLTARFHFFVTSDPEGQSASWTKVRAKVEVRAHRFDSKRRVWPESGWKPAKKPKFDGDPQTQSVQTGVYSTLKMNLGKLGNYVWHYHFRIRWSVLVEGKWLRAGTSFHDVYATFGMPCGKMKFQYRYVTLTDQVTGKKYLDKRTSCTEDGSEQHVTEKRLSLAVHAAMHKWRRSTKQEEKADELKGEDHTYRPAGLRRSKTENECVDAVFEDVRGRDIDYELTRVWAPPDGGPKTGMYPTPTLHHFLWKTMAAEAEGQCHNIAAAFILMCRILGVTGPMEVGVMYPGPGRSDKPPDYPWQGGPQGLWNQRHYRAHAVAGHGDETLGFVDDSKYGNSFEGAVKYNNKYYAIGDDIYDSPSEYFADPDDPNLGYFWLFLCPQPYDANGHKLRPMRNPSTGEFFRDPKPPHKPLKYAVFKWHFGRKP